MVFHYVILLGQGDAVLVFLLHLFCLQAPNVGSTFSKTVGVTLCLRPLADYMTLLNFINFYMKSVGQHSRSFMCAKHPRSFMCAKPHGLSMEI